MISMNRRHLLGLLAATGAAVSVQPSGLLYAEATQSAEDFDFIFFTDTHLQPELDANSGCAMAFRKIRSLHADFAIQGGDHIFDALGVPKQRSLDLFGLYDKTQQDLGMQVHHTLGNHDCFGVYPQSGMLPTDPLYGKRYFEDHVGRTFYSFDHKGVHFIILDSIGFTPDRAYEGRIDAQQLAWLQADLQHQPAARPIIVSVHTPLVSAIDNYTPTSAVPSAHHGNTVINSSQVTRLFEGHNVLAVLQGHTHINERVDWHGVPYITSGAVCGNWWHGTRLGTPEGFTVVSLRAGKLTTRYETYGFQSVDPQNT